MTKCKLRPSQVTTGSFLRWSDQFISICLSAVSLCIILGIDQICNIVYKKDKEVCRLHTHFGRWQHFIWFSHMPPSSPQPSFFLSSVGWETVLTPCTASSCWVIYSLTILLFFFFWQKWPFQSLIFLALLAHTKACIADTVEPSRYFLTYKLKHL